MFHLDMRTIPPPVLTLSHVSIFLSQFFSQAFFLFIFNLKKNKFLLLYFLQRKRERERERNLLSLLCGQSERLVAAQ